MIELAWLILKLFEVDKMFSDDEEILDVKMDESGVLPMVVTLSKAIDDDVGKDDKETILVEVGANEESTVVEGALVLFDGDDILPRLEVLLLSALDSNDELLVNAMEIGTELEDPVAVDVKNLSGDDNGDGKEDDND